MMADKDNYFSSPHLCVHAIKHRGRFCLHARANSLARKVGNEVLWPLRKWPIPNKLLSSLLSHHRRPVSAGHLFAQQKSRSGGRGRPTASSISPRPDPLPPSLFPHTVRPLAAVWTNTEAEVLTPGSAPARRK